MAGRDARGRGARTRKGSAGVPAAWADAQELPRAGTAPTRVLIRRSSWMRRSLYGVLAFAVIASVAAFAAATKTTGGAPARDGSVASTSPGRDAATAYLLKWLAQDPSPLPGATLIGWSGATEAPVLQAGEEAGSSASPGAPQPLAVVEIDSFTLMDGQGALYSATVQMGIDPRGGAAPLSGVSIAPIAPAAEDEWTRGGPWVGRRTGPVSDEVTAAIATWAKAYGSGNSIALGQAVGDPDKTHSYVPITGAASVTAAPGVGTTDRLPIGDSQIVQVTLAIAWASQSGTAAAPTLVGGIPTTLDLLVLDAGTASPKIVAWGPAGTGPALEPYQNAVLAGPARGLPTTAPAPKAS